MEERNLTEEKLQRRTGIAPGRLRQIINLEEEATPPEFTSIANACACYMEDLAQVKGAWMHSIHRDISGTSEARATQGRIKEDLE